MAKLKLSLPSGSEVEKTVISYFKSNEANYLILDAESVGSMGLPIILVSKVIGDKVVKIVDQNEWQQVKSYLKTIISGGKMEYSSVPTNLPADEVYYTQLTLPVASFDILKNSYVVEDEVNGISAPITNIVAEVAPVAMSAAEEDSLGEQPINMATDIASDEPMKAEIAMPVSNPSEPIANDMIVSVENTASIESPVENGPVLENNAVMTNPLMNEGLNSSQTQEISPVLADPMISEPTVAEPVVAPVIEAQPVVEPAIEKTPIMATTTAQTNQESKIDFNDCKTMFMQACENMFDALAAKIETELKNK
ncbi:MAG: hypothetical protein IJA94_03255 [Bacilli bacterium]|nr:hypothetical protein [Bacilli bacterium]